MNEGMEEYKTAEEMKKRLTELALELAFQMRFDAEVEALESACAEAGEKVKQTVCEADERILGRIRKQMKRGRADVWRMLRVGRWQSKEEYGNS